MGCVFVRSGCSPNEVKQGSPTRTIRWAEKVSPMNSNQVEIEAAEWLARLDRDPSAAGLTAFDRWGATDAPNAAPYARLPATWQTLDPLRTHPPSPHEPT